MIRQCLYHYRKDHIHEVRFLKSSRYAVDEWIRYLDLVQLYGEDAPAILLDFTQSGLPPVNYFIMRLREWRKANPHARFGHCAIVYEGSGMLRVWLRQLVRFFGFSISTRTKLFQGHYRDRAVQWLYFSERDVAAT